MVTTITDFISNYGYVAVAFLIAVENIFPPIPSEIILAFSGFLALTAHLNLGGLILASVISALVGALLFYYVGKLISFKKLEQWMQGKWGNFLRFKITHLQNIQSFFNKHGTSATFWGRFLPVIRSLISIPAGMANISLSKFLVFTTLGSTIWNTVLIFIGYTVGSSWEKFAILIEDYSFIVLFILIIGASISYLIYRNYKNKRQIKN